MHAPNITPVAVAGLTAIGLGQIVAPQSFNSIVRYFGSGAFASASPEQADRLARVLDVRVSAEAKVWAFAPIGGAFALLMAAAVVFLRFSPSLAFAAVVLCTALQLIVAFGEFRPSTQRRAASLTRRPWYSVLSPFALGYTAISIFAALECIAVVELRLTAILLLFSLAIMIVLAARVAAAPARLPGEDPEAERAVDERIRFFRSNAIAISASLPIYMFFAVMRGYVPDTGVYAWLPPMLSLAFATTTLFVLVLPARKPLVLG